MPISSQYSDYVVTLIPCRSDNYAFILYHLKNKMAYIIDTPDAVNITNFLDKNHLCPTAILNTHHHEDHIGGNQALQKHTPSMIIYGNQNDKKRINTLNYTVLAGDILPIFNGGISFEILCMDGHTNGHIAYYSKQLKIAFVGDAIFNLGCGRLFEGTPQQMWDSMLTLRELDPQTMLYAAHEYSLANAKFVKHYFPEITGLNDYISGLQAIRSKGEFTVPFSLESQIKYNPFMRCDDPYVKQVTDTVDKADSQTFKIVRQLKDNF